MHSVVSLWNPADKPTNQQINKYFFHSTAQKKLQHVPSNVKCPIEPKVRVRRSLWFRHFQGYVWIVVNILISAPFEEETQLEIMYMSDEHNPDLNSICLMKLQTIKPLVSGFALFFPFQPLLYFCEQRNVQVPALLQTPPPVNSQLTVRSAGHGSVRTKSRAVLFRV